MLNEATILSLKQDVYRLKALLDHPEYESFNWDVQLSKMLDNIAWWHKYEHKCHLTRHLRSIGEGQHKIVRTKI